MRKTCGRGRRSRCRTEFGELRSTNEELETNEELQGTREEMETLNDELQRRIVALDDANTHLSSVATRLRGAVVLVDAVDDMGHPQALRHAAG